jgi:outer membrane protein assembly factor BamE
MKFPHIYTGLRRFVSAFLALSFLGLSACTVYRPDITQGTQISEEMLSQISVGTPKQEVLRVLGGNSVIDPFAPEQWNYVYLKKLGANEYEKQLLRLSFDKQNKVSHIDTIGEFLKEDRNAVLEP